MDTTQLLKGVLDAAVLAVVQHEDAYGYDIVRRLRDAGLDVMLHCATPAGAGSFKSQMKKADGSGAAFAVIIGEDEVKNGVVAVKALREADAGQQQAAGTVTALSQQVEFIARAGHRLDLGGEAQVPEPAGQQID